MHLVGIARIYIYCTMHGPENVKVTARYELGLQMEQIKFIS